MTDEDVEQMMGEMGFVPQRGSADIWYREDLPYINNEIATFLCQTIRDKEDYILEIADHTHGCGLKMVPVRSVDGSVTMYCQHCDVSRPSSGNHKTYTQHQLDQAVQEARWDIDHVLMVMETGKELSQQYEKYHGDMDWGAFVEDSLKRARLKNGGADHE